MTLRTFIIFVSMALSASAEALKTELAEAALYVYSVRNAPVFKMDGKEIKAEAGDIIEAQNLTVKCGNGQSAMLVFSNKTAMLVAENSEISVVSAKHTYPFTDKVIEKTEHTVSETYLTLGNGRFYFSALSPRATSKLVITTRFGEVQPYGQKFCILQTDAQMQAVSLDGRMTCKTPDGITDFVKQMQVGTIFKRDGKYIFSPEQIRITGVAAYQTEIDKCTFAQRSVRFLCDKSDNIVSATRVIPKALVMVPAKKRK